MTMGMTNAIEIIRILELEAEIARSMGLDWLAVRYEAEAEMVFLNTIA